MRRKSTSSTKKAQTPLGNGTRKPPTIAQLGVEVRSVQREAVDQLRQAIMSGTFKPGERIVESRMCTSLGVSRPSLREALRSLEAEKLIEITPNRGPQVATLSWSDAKAIYDVRELLEGEAAALSAEGSSDEEVASMGKSLAAFARAAKKGDHEEQLEATAKFYEALLRSAGNKVIAEMIAQLSARITWLRRRSMSLPGRALQSADEMTAILEAIKRRDAKSARMAAKRHVELASKAAARAYSLIKSEL